MLDTPILETTKISLGLEVDYDVFDFELLIHINSAVANLTQLGVGPKLGLIVEEDTPWSSLLGSDHHLTNAISYMFMKVKMVFDSATMSQHLVAAYEKMIEEQEFRLQVGADPMIPQVEDPNFAVPDPDPLAG